jgi:N-acetyl-anhydromuramyl-L-alanine amidase AmpD
MWPCFLLALSSLTQIQPVSASADFVASMQAAAATVVSPDYPAASWVPASSSNYTVAHRAHDYPIDMIVIHDIEGTAGSAILAFQNPSRRASAHYVVGYDGSITQMVLEKDIAWHAGNWDYNTRAIGIEHAGYAYGTNLYTMAEYNASAQLIASICSRWGVPMDRAHVIGHYQVPDPYNPGLYGGYSHHTDPGPNWNWTYYMQQAAAAAATLPSPPHLMPDPIAVMNANGTSATITWTPARTCHTPISGYTVTGQPGNLSMSLPATATSATFNNLQTGTAYIFSVTATNADGQDSEPARWRCGLGSVTATPSSPQLSGTAVTFSATATGCPHPLFQFWILPPGGTGADWQVKRSYSSTATYTWNTTGLVAGNYLYSVWVEDTSSFGANCSYLGCNDAYLAARTYTLTSQPCTSITESASPPSSSPTGTTVAFTARASGCPHPLYQFWILPPGANWQIKQAYSSSNTFSWNTTGLVAGNYLYTAWARDQSSTGVNCSYLGCNDAFMSAPTYALTPARCTSVTDVPTPMSPQLSGTSVTFSATSSGCPHPLYQFWILPPGSSTWQIKQAYSPSATFTWNTTGLAPGNYLYTAWARDQSSSGVNCSYLGCNDAFMSAPTFSLTRQPCTSVTDSASPASPQTVGTSITFTATSSGCPQPLYQFWILPPGSSTWQIVQPWSPSATFTWNTTGLAPGSYLYTAWARDQSSTGTQCDYLGCKDAVYAAHAYGLT